MSANFSLFRIWNRKFSYICLFVYLVISVFACHTAFVDIYDIHHLRYIFFLYCIFIPVIVLVVAYLGLFPLKILDLI